MTLRVGSICLLLTGLASLAMAAEANGMPQAWGLTQGVQWFVRGGLVMYPILACSIIFLLLIFFIVATVPKGSTRRLDVQLPKAHSGLTADARHLTIGMAAAGSMTSNGGLVTPEQLERHRQPTEVDAQQSAVIERLSYGKVIQIMGLCQAAIAAAMK